MYELRHIVITILFYWANSRLHFMYINMEWYLPSDWINWLGWKFVEGSGGELYRRWGGYCGWPFRARRDASTQTAQGGAHSKALWSRKKETGKLAQFRNTKYWVYVSSWFPWHYSDSILSLDFKLMIQLVQQMIYLATSCS